MNRRSFLQMMCVTAAAAPLGSLAAAPQSKRPNIAILLADDLGFSDIGCYGSEIDTPNLNRLAQGGIRFTQFRNTARCCPSRASLLTGLYSHQAGVGLMVEDRGRPAYQGYLNDRCATLAEVLRSAGYRTLMSGKWHVGEHRPHWPRDRGFERYFGLISGACNYFRLDDPERQRQMALDDKPWAPPPTGFYMTDAITDHAVEFLDRYGRGEQPFFLYTAFTAPHYPLHALPEDIAKHEGKYMKGWDALRRERRQRMIEMGIVDKRWPLTQRDEQAPAWETVADKKAWDRRMAVYAAQIDRMDQGIGRILRKIHELGENTLIMFLSDNGGCAEVVDRGKPGVPPGLADSFMSYGIPWANASNTPFRLYKRWVHEGGVATPFIVHWPSVIKQKGTLTHQVGHLIDIMPTCLDVAGAKYPGAPVQPMEGKSLLPALEGKSIGDRKLYWEHMGNCAALEGNWKLVSRYPRKWELYDLEADRTEMNDLAARMPDKAAQLFKDYNIWAQRCGVAPWDEIRPRSGKQMSETLL